MCLKILSNGVFFEENRLFFVEDLLSFLGRPIGFIRDKRFYGKVDF